ncbi:MAG: class II aldolase/adducin family protein [Candidatus Methanoplasma sp.]|jgi:L-fuculose-phosphate aldolase|nr:class II aldolase/adducin family protein [Candidatus Methanoplasma sp.]
MNELLGRRRLTDACKMLYDRNLTVSAGGNMSVRLGDDLFLITPSGRNKGLLCPEDAVLINSKGKPLSDGKPSIEHKFHLALYAANPGTTSVIHCHPLHCIALTVSGRKMQCGLTPEGVMLLGDVPTLGYFTPGSKELVEAVRAHSSHGAMLLERHGAITQGRDLEEAFNRMEELEFQARLQLLVGDAEDLPEKEIAKLRKM